LLEEEGIIEEGRVTEVWVADGDGGARGTGHRVAADLVLTARHVVAGGGDCRVRPLGAADWAAADVVWQGRDCDAALLRVARQPADWRPVESVRLGRIAGARRVPCEALGFPAAQAVAAGPLGEDGDTERLAGEIDPLTTLRAGYLTIHIDGSVPLPDPGNGSPWGGMSGAAVVAEGLVVGVVVVHPRRFGSDRVAATPVTAMVAEPGFLDELARSADVASGVLAVEALGVLREPYRPLPFSPSSLRGGATNFLVRPEYGTVPFRGREDDFAWLDALGGDRSGVSVALVLGAGGTGKTRFAAAACERSIAAGGIAGFLEPRFDEKRLERLLAAPDPMTIVVDEVHARARWTLDALGAIARSGRAAPTRVVLVGRQAGDWWDRMRAGGDAEDDAATAVLADAVVRELSPVEDLVEGREAAFREAARAFAARMGIALDDVPTPPDLSGGLFEPILFVHLAALTAIDSDADLGGRALVRADLLEAALSREARHWAETARVAGLDLGPRVLERAAALATMTRAHSEGEAADTLAAVPDLADASQALRRDVAWWLRELYPAPVAESADVGEDWFRPLAPDLLAEALVARVLGDLPDLPRRVLERVGFAQAKPLLTSLAFAARSHPAVEGPLHEVIAPHLEDVWEVVIEVAQETGEVTGRAATAAVEGGLAPDLALEMVSKLPASTVALLEFSAIVVEAALEATMAAPPSRERDLAIAYLRRRLAWRLSELGRREDALAMCRESVALYGELDQDDPEVRSGLVDAISGMSVFLEDLRESELAVEAGERALAIRRKIAEEDGSDDSLLSYAMALNSLSPALAGVGRYVDAIGLADEAVAVTRTVAERNDFARRYLGVTLTNQAGHLTLLGRYKDALPASAEAVGIYRALADAEPDAFLPDLALALHNHSGCLAKLGLFPEALEAIQESVGIRRRLVSIRPAVFQRVFVESLNTQAVVLGYLGRPKDGLRASTEALALYRELVEASPEVFLPGLATLLGTHSNRLRDLDRHDEALAASDEAVAIVRKLAEGAPDAYSQRFARILIGRGTLFVDSGRVDEGLEVLDEAMAMFRTAVAVSPALLSELVILLNTRAEALARAGRDDEAVAASREAKALARDMDRETPA
jgi:tetratricopeptide (TPR) repeat protein